VASALAFAVQTWVIDRAGPVFASVYLPVQTILVAVMASVFLGEEFYLGGWVSSLYLIFYSSSSSSSSLKFSLQKLCYHRVGERFQAQGKV
jgi:drug/metabolite transporter (DMT)-like permease